MKSIHSSTTAGPAKPAQAPETAAAQAHHHHASGWRGAAMVTAHCLLGCAIGELTGLSIGVFLGWLPRLTVSLAVLLSFVSGFALAVIPLIRSGVNFFTALDTVWLGEATSIATMEAVMNWVDWKMGGMRGVSLSSRLYWYSFAIALVGGFFGAWPVNRWMLARNIKRCHG
jgi:hypothetical protein